MFDCSTDRFITFAVSLVLAALAIASYRFHIPTIGQFLVEHRMETLIAAYVVLAAGVVVRGL